MLRLRRYVTFVNSCLSLYCQILFIRVCSKEVLPNVDYIDFCKFIDICCTCVFFYCGEYTCKRILNKFCLSEYMYLLYSLNILHFLYNEIEQFRIQRGRGVSTTVCENQIFTLFNGRVLRSNNSKISFKKYFYTVSVYSIQYHSILYTDQAVPD